MSESENAKCSKCGTALVRDGWFTSCPTCLPGLAAVFGLFVDAEGAPLRSPLELVEARRATGRPVEVDMTKAPKLKGRVARKAGARVPSKSKAAISGSCSIKRSRRTKADIQVICDAMVEVLEAERPMTCRQVFYRLVGLRVVAKTEKEYKSTVCRLLARMRRDLTVPYQWIADSTRWVRRPLTYSSMEQALNDTATTYRRALWDNQNAYCEIWIEKDALSGVIYEITDRYDVPLMVVRGFSSLSFLYGAAETIKAVGKPTYLYYFGDLDPSGVLIPKVVERELRRLAPDADITFERVGVTPEQVVSMDLPTRPTKSKGTHAKSFKGASVEVDTIPSPVLRGMVEECITQHIDTDALALTYAAEMSERAVLMDWRENFDGGNPAFLG